MAKRVQWQRMDEVFKSGWLFMRGAPEFGSPSNGNAARLLRWEKRWCVLRMRCIEFFEDEQCKLQRGRTEFSASSQAIPFQSSPVGESHRYANEKPYGFTLDIDPAGGADRRIFYFEAQNKMDLNSWTDAFTGAVENLGWKWFSDLSDRLEHRFDEIISSRMDAVLRGQNGQTDYGYNSQNFSKSTMYPQSPPGRPGERPAAPGRSMYMSKENLDPEECQKEVYMLRERVKVMEDELRYERMCQDTKDYIPKDVLRHCPSTVAADVLEEVQRAQEPNPEAHQMDVFKRIEKEMQDVHYSKYDRLLDSMEPNTAKELEMYVQDHVGFSQYQYQYQYESKMGSLQPKTETTFKEANVLAACKDRNINMWGVHSDYRSGNSNWHFERPVTMMPEQDIIYKSAGLSAVLRDCHDTKKQFDTLAYNLAEVMTSLCGTRCVFIDRAVKSPERFEETSAIEGLGNAASMRDGLSGTIMIKCDGSTNMQQIYRFFRSMIMGGRQQEDQMGNPKVDELMRKNGASVVFFKERFSKFKGDFADYQSSVMASSSLSPYNQSTHQSTQMKQDVMPYRAGQSPSMKRQQQQDAFCSYEDYYMNSKCNYQDWLLNLCINGLITELRFTFDVAIMKMGPQYLDCDDGKMMEDNLMRSAMTCTYPRLQIALHNGGWRMKESLQKSFIRDAMGLTPLHYAAHHGHTGMVTSLLNANADPFACDHYDMMPIIRASDRNHGGIVLQLAGVMQQYCEQLTTLSDWCKQALLCSWSRACKKGALYEETLWKLLQLAVPAEGDMVHFAAAAGDTFFLTKMLDKLWTNPTRMHASAGAQIYPLDAAVLAGQVGTARMIAEHGGNFCNIGGAVPHQSPQGAAMNYVARDQHMQLAALMAVGKGFDMRALTTLAVQQRCWQSLQILVSQGAVLPENAAIEARNALMEASGCGAAAEVSLLLELKVPPDAQGGGDQDYAALHRAAVIGSTVVCKLLLQANATVDILVRATQFTPLFLAACQGKHEVVQLLISARASVNCKTVSGERPVDGAAFYGHVPVLRVLHAAGAVIDKASIDKAMQNQHTKAIEFLRDAEQGRINTTSFMYDGTYRFSHQQHSFAHGRGEMSSWTNAGSNGYGGGPNSYGYPQLQNQQYSQGKGGSDYSSIFGTSQSQQWRTDMKTSGEYSYGANGMKSLMDYSNGQRAQSPNRLDQYGQNSILPQQQRQQSPNRSSSPFSQTRTGMADGGSGTWQQQQQRTFSTNTMNASADGGTNGWLQQRPFDYSGSTLGSGMGGPDQLKFSQQQSPLGSGMMGQDPSMFPQQQSPLGSGMIGQDQSMTWRSPMQSSNMMSSQRPLGQTNILSGYGNDNNDSRRSPRMQADRSGSRSLSPGRQMRTDPLAPMNNGPSMTSTWDYGAGRSNSMGQAQSEMGTGMDYGNGAGRSTPQRNRFP